VLDERSDAQLTEIFSKPVAVIPLVSSKGPQLARRHAGELLTHFGVASFLDELIK
jgi:hypothetical protein